VTLWHLENALIRRKSSFSSNNGVFRPPPMLLTRFPDLFHSPFPTFLPPAISDFSSAAHRTTYTEDGNGDEDFVVFILIFSFISSFPISDLRLKRKYFQPILGIVCQFHAFLCSRMAV
jgi:hypothetical protein